MTVIEKKYAERRIVDMSDAEILTNIAGSLKRIHVITGWNLPDDVEYMKILTEEFHKKLKEDFYMMNFSEIVYAFRKNGLGVKDWGKNTNLDLICNVLTQYCEERTKISAEEERIILQPKEMKINSDEQLDNFYRQWTEEFYQRIRSGRIENVPAYCQEILIKDGLMKEGESVAAFFVKSLNENRQNIYLKDATK